MTVIMHLIFVQFRVILEGKLWQSAFQTKNWIDNPLKVHKLVKLAFSDLDEINKIINFAKKPQLLIARLVWCMLNDTKEVAGVSPEQVWPVYVKVGLMFFLRPL